MDGDISLIIAQFAEYLTKAIELIMGFLKEFTGKKEEDKKEDE